MSSIKEYRHEIWSQRDAEINFLCPDCGHPASAFHPGIKTSSSRRSPASTMRIRTIGQ